VLYHYFLGRVDRIIDQLEESATELLERYWGEDEAAPPEPDETGASPERPAARASLRARGV
jgi:hypothetical protein